MRGVVSVCVLIGIVCGCGTREANGISLTAPVRVSVDVIRSCAVVSGASAGLLTLACSNRVTPLSVARRGLTSEVRVVTGGNHGFSLAYPTRSNADPAARSNQPFRVIVNF